MENGVIDNGHHESSSLFHKELLWDIDAAELKASYNPSVSPSNPGEDLIMRPLSLDDYDKGFINVLRDLTECGEISRELFTERFNGMKSCPGTYYIAVIEDTKTSQIIGTGTLVVEQKFIHETATRGRIEDVVVYSAYRGKQLGKLLVDTLTVLGIKLGTYKITLECRDKNMPFYNRMGFLKDEGNNYMVLRLKH